MARFVNFHGRTIIHPGAEAFVDLTGMVQPGLDVTRVGALIAEAPYGDPGVVHVFADAESVRQFFGTGSDAANAADLYFNPSNDERVIGGVTILYIYKPNRSEQAERWMVRDLDGGQFPENSVTDSATVGTEKNKVTDADDPIDTTPAYVEIPQVIASPYAADLFKNLVVEITTGPGKGQQRQIGSSAQSTADPTKYRLFLRPDLKWTTIPFQGSLYDVRVRIVAPMYRLLSTEFGPRGLHNTVEHSPHSSKRSFLLSSKYRKRVEATPFEVGGDEKPTLHVKFDPTDDNGLSSFVTPATWVIPQTLEGTTPIEGTTGADVGQTILDGGHVDMVTDAYANQWVIITGLHATTPAKATLQAPLLGKIFRIKSNTDGTGGPPIDSLTLYEPGLNLPLVDDADLDGLQWKVIAVSDVYLESEGADGVATSLKVFWTNQGLTPIGYAVVDLIKYPTLDDVVQKLNEFGGITAQLGDGVDPELPSSRFDFGRQAEHYGRQSVGILKTATVGPWTSLVLDDAGNKEGSVNFPTDGFPYFVVINEGTAIQEIARVTANDGTDTLTVDPIGTVVHAIDSVVSLITDNEVIYQFGSNLIVAPTDTTNLGDVVRDNNQKMVEAVPSIYGRFTAERAIGPGSITYKAQIGTAHPEDDNAFFKAFYNGDEGESIVNPDLDDPFYPISWKHGLDELKKVKDIRNIALAVSEDLPNWSSGDIEVLLGLFDAHLRDAEDARAERQGYFGFTRPLRAGTFLGQTFTRGLLDWARFYNDERLALSGQTTNVILSTGIETTLPPWGFAVQQAGIQLGTDIGEGLTLKFIKTAALTQPFNDWDPRDLIDMREALLGGILFGEPDRGRWRIVRGQTTHISTNNLARTDINVWEIRNFILRGTRELLEDSFGGRRTGTNGENIRLVAPASVANIREVLTDYLDELRSDGIIIDSEDEQGQIVNAFRALSVRISGDVAIISFQVFPATSLNFILIDIGFQLPRISG